MLSRYANLESLNTMRVKIFAPGVSLFSDPDETVRYLSDLGRDKREKMEVAGELSNTLLGDAIDASLLLFRDGTIIDISAASSLTKVRVAGSCTFDSLVQQLCELNVPGFELLSGIPGTVGAAVVQNIAAYGQKISDHFLSAIAFDRETGSIVELDASKLQFSYRSSSLKEEGRFTPRLLVLEVLFAFDKRAVHPLLYEDLRRRHIEKSREPDDLSARRRTVLEVRNQKGLVVGGENWIPNVGSFFLSPVVSAETALAISKTIRGTHFAKKFLSWYKPDGNLTRLPAALLIRACGFMNGDRWGQTGLSPHHILAICNFSRASGSDVAMVARIVQERAQSLFGIALHREVRSLGHFHAQDLSSFIDENPFTAGKEEPQWAVALGDPEPATSSKETVR